MENLKEKYKKEVVPAMQESFGIKNALALPRLEKVVINVGINSRQTDSGYLDMVEKTLRQITGQKPIRTKARKAISAFKVRENMVVGMKVTLRGQKMYDFLQKLINVSIPRIRDFRGLSTKCIDRQGNLSLGFRESNVFPEIKADEVEKAHGLEVTVVANAGSYDKGFAFFKLLGFPFQANKSK